VLEGGEFAEVRGLLWVAKGFQQVALVDFAAAGQDDLAAGDRFCTAHGEQAFVDCRPIRAVGSSRRCWLVIGPPGRHGRYVTPVIRTSPGTAKSWRWSRMNTRVRVAVCSM